MIIEIALGLFCVILIIICGCLLRKLDKKQIIDRTELNKYQGEVELLYGEKNQKEAELDRLKKEISDTLEQSNQLEETLRQKAAAQMEIIQRKVDSETAEIEEKLNVLRQSLKSRSQDYADIISPMALLQKEQQEKLFYTIHLTPEEKCDIIYLLKEVAPHVSHKDILSKLVWQEFIKTPLEETLKRVGITQNAGIYKITNINNGMCYVGKSTNVKKRIQDHFKSVVGIQSISDQRVHHAIMDEGIDMWTIEQICECDKAELNEKEKFYIEFFKSQEYGYNMKAGG